MLLQLIALRAYVLALNLISFEAIATICDYFDAQQSLMCSDPNTMSKKSNR